MKREERTPETAWQLARAIMWAQRGKLVLGLALLFVDRAAGFVLPFAPKVLLDDVVAKRRSELLPWLAAAVVLAALVQAGAAFGLQRVLGLSAELVVLGWRRRIMARITRLPASWLDTQQTGSLISRVMDDAAAMQNLVGSQLARWTSNIVTAAFAFVALLWIDWQLTLIALASAGLPGLALNFAYKKMRPLYRERGELRASVTGRLAQTLSGIRVVKAFTAERREQLVFTRGLHRLYRVMSATTNRRGAMSAIAGVIYSAVVAIVLVMGARAILAGRMSLGDFGSYVAFALMFSAPLVDLPEIATRLSETLADLDRVRAVEAILPEDEGDDARAPLAAFAGTLAFEDVSFAYVPKVKVLERVSFTAKAGTTTAIVGPSGAGKSTLFALVLAFRRPTTGRIRVGDRDLASVPLRDWRRRLAVVLQDDFLFDGTLADNIALGRPNATRAEIEAAKAAANCDFGGLDTVIGERGMGLSGGQRQRVSIARAILKDAPVLLFDEATSSLDSESEAAVRGAMATLVKGRTVLVIAHRLSTVRAADQILVLDRGRLVERGTHASLLRKWALSVTLRRPIIVGSRAMSFANLVPDGINPSAEHQNVLLELAYLTTAVDGKLHNEELEAFKAVIGRLRKTTATDADVDALLDKFAVSVDHREITDRVQKIASTLPPELRDVAFKIAVGLSVSDLDANDDEVELQVVLAEALGFDDAKVDALTAEVYASLDAGEE